ncbi:Monocarboxylate transporter 7 [Holothuria leucospilota]|uniref:Monocarboxylate transporter 7 n=1 Tax=Holothuria leucospilota TaxID=206669 RepID=A0A9Q1BNN4_HOLLE|nr:Monocarboxylate transporter 7 [Holothuria leucospilota]
MGVILWNTVAGGVGLIHRTSPTKQDKLQTNSSKAKEVTEEGSEVIKSEQLQNRETVPLLIPKAENEGLPLAEKYLPCFSAILRHRNFSILVLFEALAFYIYTSWALFLVSLGTTQGLIANQAALLSTVGGVAGVFGRLAAALFFHFNVMDAFVGNQVPVFLNGITLLGCVFATNFYILALLTVFSGLSQGFHQASLLGMLPSQVCEGHFRQAAVISFSLDGLFMQFGGLISGAIVSVMGSTIYVFAFNAMLCFVVLPLGFLWVCQQNQPVQNCNSYTS